MRNLTTGIALLMLTASANAEPAAKTVAAEELGIGSRKHMGQAIEVPNMRCYYADVEDYRCVAGGYTNVVVFTETIEPESMRQHVENQCDTLDKMVSSPKCVFKLRFSYDEDSVSNDTLDGNKRRTIIRPDEVTLVASQSKGNGKRRR